MKNSDKFVARIPEMKKWLSTRSAQQATRELLRLLQTAPIPLIKIGELDIASQYRSFVRDVLHRNTQPGELKVLLRQIPGLRISGDAQSEICELEMLAKIESSQSNISMCNDAKGRFDKYEMFDFAYCYEGHIQDLANLALPEDWTVDSRYEFGVLKSYLRNTFEKLWIDGAVFVEKGRCAAFNTGLVDKHYDPIVAYFVPNFPGQRQLWKLKFFCTWGSGPEGKECVANVKKLPASARWFTDFAQVFLEPDAEIVRSWEHFAYDNMCRIPLHVLRDCSRFSHEVEAMLDSYPINSTDDETKKFIEEFKRKLEETGYQDRFDFNLRAKFEYAINLAMKKVRWNFNCAVPMFFPSRRTFSFLLPLSLDDPSIVDVALVVDRVKDATNSIYQAQTILTLSMAYTNARLLRRPDASWLCCLTNGHGRVQPDMSPANEMSRDGISHSSKAADEFSDKEKNVGVIGNKAQAVSSIDDCSRDGDCAAESGESVSGDYTSPDAVERLRSKLKYLD